MSNKAYRLGLDIGTNSIGWAVIDIEKQKAKGDKEARFLPTRIRDMGARIFSDGRNPKDGTSLAVSRREARSARRRRDRYIARRRKLVNALVRLGLMPKDEGERQQLKVLNPYQLRAQAVKQALPPFFLGRALYHLNQRRGFKSNRKTSSKDEMKNIGPEIEGLRQAKGLKTLGEYFWERYQEGKTVRARPIIKKQKEDLAPERCLYPERAMLEDEFDRIRETQSDHQELKEADWEELRDIIFFQRDLKPVMPGRCTIEPEQFRAPIALPSYQKFTIAQNLHNLEIIFPEDRRRKNKLTADQMDLLWEHLQSHKTMSFNAVQKKLKLEGIVEFNLETERRRELKGNAIAYMLSKKEYFGKKWFDFGDEEQDDIVEELLHIEEPEELIKKAQEEWGVSETSAHHLADLTPDDFPKGYGRYCKSVLQKVTEVMVHQGLPFHEATLEAGFHHSKIDVEPRYDRLDYYGKWLTTAVTGNDPSIKESEVKKEEFNTKHYGRIPNPTVHIGLGQLMHVVNALIELYGKPSEVVIEVARELKQSYEQKQEIRKLQKKNQDDNKRIDGELEKLRQTLNRDNRIKYKLWEELSADVNDRRCPFSLKIIPPSKLFSNEIEIEHILPFSRTLDDSINNKTVSFTEANRYKGKRSPEEAFNSSGSPYKYDDIMKRVGNLPPRKRWRFDSDAMERFRNEEEFLSRAINDTAYLSRLSKQYLQHVVPHQKIWVVPGRLTAFLRYRWGLDGVLGKKGLKNRDDHRHHSLDAMVVAFTDRSILQKISYANSLDEKKDLVTPTPLGSDAREFFSIVKGAVEKIVVSHRPDHSTGGQLHEETSYGKINPNKWEKEQGYNVVSRKALESLSENEIDAVRDPALRRRLIEHTGGLTGKAFKEALSIFAENELEQLKDMNEVNVKKQKIRHVRILKKENPLVEVVHMQGDQTHVKALAPGEIHHVSFWVIPPGKKGCDESIPLKIKEESRQVVAKGVSVYDANRFSPGELKPHPAAKLILKVHKNDTLKLEYEGEEVIARVESLSPVNRKIWLVGVKEGGKLSERAKKGALKRIYLAFNNLKKYKVRRVHVDPIGRVKDGGPVL